MEELIKKLRDICKHWHCRIKLSCSLHDKDLGHPIMVNYDTKEKDDSEENKAFITKVGSYDKTLSIKVHVSFKSNSYMRFYNDVDLDTFGKSIEADIIKFYGD